MTGFVVSSILQNIGQLEPDEAGLEIHGANLSIAKTFRRYAANPKVEAIELFLHPMDYQRQSLLAELAASILPVHRRGKGVLRFYPLNNLPEVWADGAERVLLCVDPELLPRDRYLRDRYAVGPTPISCQTHGLAKWQLYRELSTIAAAWPVPYDAILCLSEATRGSIHNTFCGYLAPADHPVPIRLERTTNPVDSEMFCVPTPQEKHHARKMLGLPQDKTITLYLGRLTPDTKADLLPLIDAFGKVSKSTDLLLLAGIQNTEGYTERLAATAESLGYRDRFAVRIPVQPWTAPLYYAAADLFVFPCDNAQECCGNTVLEAMAAGLPTIASDWDGNRDSVVDGETGFLLPTYFLPGLERVEALSPAFLLMDGLLPVSQNTVVDAVALEQRLKQLLEDQPLREKMGAAARKRALTVFSPETVDGGVFRIWEQLISIARTESPEDREKRRAEAPSIGLPIPYRHLFAPYATNQGDLLEWRILLTDFGAKVLDNKESIGFYDETISMIRPDAMDTILELVKQNPSKEHPFQDLSRICAESCKISLSDAQFHVGLLIKRGVFHLKTTA